jgi:carbamoyltransferase
MTLKWIKSSYEKVKNPAAIAAHMLSTGKIIAWYQGRSEFGPRALGHRSILADPLASRMKDKINSKVKFREEFRPFAPSVLSAYTSEIFNVKSSSPYMTITFPVKDNWKNRLGAVVHIDGTSRIQTVEQKNTPLYHRLITEFHQITGVPVILNTSFNIRGQPIVETPLQALSTFASTGLDALFIENFIIKK